MCETVSSCVQRQVVTHTTAGRVECDLSGLCDQGDSLLRLSELGLELRASSFPNLHRGLEELYVT